MKPAFHGFYVNTRRNIPFSSSKVPLQIINRWIHSGPLLRSGGFACRVNMKGPHFCRMTASTVRPRCGEKQMPALSMSATNLASSARLWNLSAEKASNDPRRPAADRGRGCPHQSEAALSEREPAINSPGAFLRALTADYYRNLLAMTRRERERKKEPLMKRR